MRLLVVLLAAVLVSGCSPKQIGLNRMADALTSTANSYSRDSDLEFVRLAAPSTLKMVEMMLDGQPTHEGMLVTGCSGFTQYSYAFLQLDSEIAQPSNPTLAADLKARATAMYQRARDYCLRALEVRHRGFRAEIGTNAKSALSHVDVADVPALFWLGASWGGELSLADNQLVRLGELATVRAVLERALALDETWRKGVIHGALIVFDALPA